MAVVTLGGCAQSDERSPAPVAAQENGAASVDPCALLTKQDIRTILGADAGAAKGPTNEFKAAKCAWEFPDGSVVGTGTLSVSVWQGAAFFNRSLGKPLPGLGDEAVSEEGVVSFRSGETVVLVHVLSPTKKSQAVKIASAVAGHL